MIEDRPLRVSLVTGTYPPVQCGVGFHTAFLARALVAQGVEVTVITWEHGQGGSRGLHPDDPWVITLDASPLHWRLVSDRLEQIRPDVVHVQLPVRRDRLRSVLLFPLLRMTYRRAPVLLTLHEFTEGRMLSFARGAALIAGAEHVIFPNPRDLDIARRLFPRAKARFHHIPIGPTLPIEQALRNGQPLREAHALAYLGILYPGKGLEVLLMAVARVASRFRHVRLHILSAFDPHQRYHRHLRDLADRLAIADQVVWYSYLSSEEVAARLVRCSIACLPYPQGATLRRSTLLEALAAGTAVITTRTRWTPDHLISAGAAWFVPPGDVTALATAIERLWQDSDLAQFLRERGQALSREFTWDVIASQTVQLYQKVLEHHVRSANIA
jgi:glycosyltransferase involved in cell wall biosynthesis